MVKQAITLLSDSQEMQSEKWVELVLASCLMHKLNLHPSLGPPCNDSRDRVDSLIPDGIRGVGAEQEEVPWLFNKIKTFLGKDAALMPAWFNVLKAKAEEIKAANDIGVALPRYFLNRASYSKLYI